MAALRQCFVWSHLDPDDDSRLVTKEGIEALETKISHEEKRLKELQKKLEEINSTLDKYTMTE